MILATFRNVNLKLELEMILREAFGIISDPEYFQRCVLCNFGFDEAICLMDLCILEGRLEGVVNSAWENHELSKGNQMFRKE